MILYSATRAAADFFGGSISRDTVLREFRAGRLHGVHVGGRVLFSDEDLATYLKDARTRAMRLAKPQPRKQSAPTRPGLEARILRIVAREAK